MIEMILDKNGKHTHVSQSSDLGKSLLPIRKNSVMIEMRVICFKNDTFLQKYFIIDQKRVHSLEVSELITCP
jgi:hypothetical protein